MITELLLLLPFFGLAFLGIAILSFRVRSLRYKLTDLLLRVQQLEQRAGEWDRTTTRVKISRI